MELTLDIIKSALESVGLSDCDIHPWDSENFKVTKKGTVPFTPDASMVPTINMEMLCEEIIKGDTIDLGEVKWISDGVMISHYDGIVEVCGSIMTTINLADPESIKMIGLAIKESFEITEQFYNRDESKH